MRGHTLLCTALMFMGGACAPAPAQEKGLLKLVATVELPGVEGRIDHFAADLEGHRIFLAALGNNSVEAIDTASFKHLHSQKGMKEPQGVVYVPGKNWLVVASGQDGMLRRYDCSTWNLVGKIEGLDDADNVRYDSQAKRIYVGFGKGALAVVDAEKFVKIGEIPLEAHPESFQLESPGGRIFVNVTGAGHVAVVDPQKMTVTAKWAVEGASAHFPMALDSANHHLFIGCRKPAKLIVFDTQNGKQTAEVECVGDADDVFYDSANKRIYVIGGGGAVDVIEQSDADHYRRIDSIKTAPGARTGWFVPQDKRLYVAVPHRGGQKAEVRVFEAGSP